MDERTELERLKAAVTGLLDATSLVVQHHPAGASVVARWAQEAAATLGRHVKPDRPTDAPTDAPTEPTASEAGEGSP